MATEQNLESFLHLIDAVKASAFKRGAKAADWNDVWMMLCRQREYTAVLRDKGIDASGLWADVSFAARFETKYGPITPSIDALAENVRIGVIAEINAALESTKAIQDEAQRGMANALLENVYMRATAMLDPRDHDERLIRESVMQSIIGSVTSLVDVNSENGQDFMESFMGVLNASLAQRATLNEPITFMQGMLQNPAGPPTPLQVVDTVMAITRSDIGGLWIRNGLLTDSPEAAQMWDEILPSAETIALAHGALGVAEGFGGGMLEARMLVMPLLRNRDVIVHLIRMGIKDAVVLRDRVGEILFKDEIAREKKTNIWPVINEEFRALLWDIDAVQVAITQKDRRAPETLLHLIRNHPAIDKALYQAGLRRRMLKQWDDSYDINREPKDDNDEKKRGSKPFEIPDHMLEDLIRQYCTDYTALAASRKFDPMVGNDDVVAQVETTLLKRGRKNPLILGEEGTGKTKIFEGLAHRMNAGKSPAKLVGGRLIMIDLHSINTSPYVGIFESRVLPILKGAAERNASGLLPPILIGIDEFGSAQNAGAHSKGDGAKELLKPYLASGDLFIIGAMTTPEYQKTTERDRPLARRFNVVSNNTPTDEQTAEILLRNKRLNSSHHGLRIPDRLMPVVAKLAGRYGKGNQPDKSIDMLDLACALAARADARTLDMDHVIRAASQMSGIDRAFLGGSDNERYIKLGDHLNDDVIEQSKAVDTVAAALKRARAGLKDPKAPIGNFLFLGPTGVGKTELVRALARRLMGGENAIIRFNMSEFQERQSVARFIGAPAGYVGFEEGGGLINAVRAKPHSVVLFDEIEKAHPDVFDTLLAPFEDGVIKDGRGMEGNMRECINIMTSNLGAVEVQKKTGGRAPMGFRNSGTWDNAVRPIYEAAVREFFKPEFLNRLDAVVIFNSLSPQGISILTDRRIGKTRQMVEQGYNGLTMSLSADFRDAVVAAGYNPVYGARPLDRAVKDMLETPLANFLLATPKKALRGKTLHVESRDRSDQGLEQTTAQFQLV